MFTWAVFLLISLSAPGSRAAPLTREQAFVRDSGWINGVNFGGWLLTEPSWMYDQFSAPAENDLVQQWRQEGGDDYAIQAFKNHWGGYIPDSVLDTIQTFGITHVRLPVGYWIVDAPNSSATMYDFGFNEEGFVTGGINYLEEMLSKLKSRNIQAVVDVHAVPGAGSQCQSYAGMQIDNAGISFWQGSVPSNGQINSGCGGPYKTTRASGQSWMEIGESSVMALAKWVVGLQSSPSMSDTVVGIEMVNEPGLGWGGQQNNIENYHLEIVPQVQQLLSDAGLDNVLIDVNFIGPNDSNMGEWLATQEKSGKFESSPAINVDFHNYYNWAGSLNWQQLAADICGSNADSGWSQYTNAQPSQPTWIGEWSDATNLDNPGYTNIDDPDIAANLAILHANQMSLYYTSPSVVGQFYWTVRMGSGWQPWPTSECPNGCQISGTAPDSSLSSFPYRVWNLAELISYGIAKPLSAYNIQGQCECNGCNASLPAGNITWSPGSNCMYAEGCDFPGGGEDIGNALMQNYECSDACYNEKGCTNFVWSGYNGGTCWFKGPYMGADEAVPDGEWGILCGIMSFEGTWTQGTSALTATGCDFINHDLGSNLTSSADCPSACASFPGCTNFVWSSYAGGTCFYKSGNQDQTYAIPNGDSSAVCGIMMGTKQEYAKGKKEGSVEGKYSSSAIPWVSRKSNKLNTAAEKHADLVQQS